MNLKENNFFLHDDEIKENTNLKKKKIKSIPYMKAIFCGDSSIKKKKFVWFFEVSITFNLLLVRNDDACEKFKIKISKTKHRKEKKRRKIKLFRVQRMTDREKKLKWNNNKSQQNFTDEKKSNYYKFFFLIFFFHIPFVKTCERRCDTKFLLLLHFPFWLNLYLRFTFVDLIVSVFVSTYIYIILFFFFYFVDFVIRHSLSNIC